MVRTMRSRSRRAAWGGTLLIVVAACGGGPLTKQEYTDEVATVLSRVDTRLQASADELLANPDDMNATRAYLDDRVEGYEEMVDGIGGLDPPEDAQEIHEVFVDLLEELLALGDSCTVTFAPEAPPGQELHFTLPVHVVRRHGLRSGDRATVSLLAAGIHPMAA